MLMDICWSGSIKIQRLIDMHQQNIIMSYILQTSTTTITALSDGHRTSPAENNRLIIFWPNLWPYMMNVSVPGGGPSSEDSLTIQTPDCHQCRGMGFEDRGVASMSSQSLLLATSSCFSSSSFHFHALENKIPIKQHSIKYSFLPFTEVMAYAMLEWNCWLKTLHRLIKG